MPAASAWSWMWRRIDFITGRMWFTKAIGGAATVLYGKVDAILLVK